LDHFFARARAVEFDSIGRSMPYKETQVKISETEISFTVKSGDNQVPHGTWKNHLFF
jgi:hypothetical protein